MKTVLLILLSLLVGNNAPSQNRKSFIHPKLDHRIELINIVYYIASKDSSVYQFNPYYFQQVNDYFSKFLKHPAIAYTKELIEKNKQDPEGLSSWILPSLAVHLDHDFNIIKTNEAELNNDTWDERRLLDSEYPALIKQFNQDSKASAFFSEQKGYFQSVESIFSKQNITIDISWHEKFYSIQTTETYFPIQSLAPAGGAYMRVNYDKNRRFSFTLFGNQAFDQKGKPMIEDNSYYLWAMLHESIHCFSNQLIEADTNTWKSIGEKLLQNEKVNSKVQNTFYGNWRYFLYESIVRATANLYNTDHGYTRSRKEEEINTQIDLGFVWMRDFVDLLEKYKSNRKTFKNMNEFLPTLINRCKELVYKY